MGFHESPKLGFLALLISLSWLISLSCLLHWPLRAGLGSVSWVLWQDSCIGELETVRGRWDGSTNPRDSS